MESRNIVSIQKEKNEYMIKMGSKVIITTWTYEESELRDWLTQIQHLYLKKNNKRHPLVVGLFADRSTNNYSNGCSIFYGKDKDSPYQLLQLCVGNHCLLWRIPAGDCFHYSSKRGWPVIDVPKSLKDFLNNNRTTVVGVKIKDIVRKLENETELSIPKALDLRDLAEEKMRRMKGDLRKYKVHKLAKLVLGETETELTRPNKLSWWDPADSERLSDDLVKFASIEVFLAAELGSNLLSRS